MIATDEVESPRLGRWAGKLAWFGIFHPRTTLGLAASAICAAIFLCRADAASAWGADLVICGALGAVAAVVRRRLGVGLVGAAVGAAAVRLADALLQRGYLQFSAAHLCLSGSPFGVLSWGTAPIAVAAAAIVDAAVAARVAGGRDLLTAWREGAADAAPRLAAGALAVVAAVLFVGTVEFAPVMTAAAAGWFLLAAAVNGAVLASLVLALSAWDALGARRRRPARVAAAASPVVFASRAKAPRRGRPSRFAASVCAVGVVCALLAAFAAAGSEETCFGGGALFGIALGTLGLAAFGASATQAAVSFAAGVASALAVWAVEWIFYVAAAFPRGLGGGALWVSSLAAVFVAFATRRRAGASLAAPLVALSAVLFAAVLGLSRLDREVCAFALFVASPLIGFGAARLAGLVAERIVERGGAEGGDAGPAD